MCYIPLLYTHLEKWTWIDFNTYPIQSRHQLIENRRENWDLRLVASIFLSLAKSIQHPLAHMGSKGYNSRLIHLLLVYYPLPCMLSKGYYNRLVCLLVCSFVCFCTSYFSQVSSFITWYFGQLGFSRHRIDANRNGFSRVCFVIKKIWGSALALLYAHSWGTVSEL